MRPAISTFSNDSYIRKFDIHRVLTNFAGNGQNGYSGDGGPALRAKVNGPDGVTVDAAGNVYFVDRNSVVRKVDTSGIITTVAGTPPVAGTVNYGYSGDGGPATAAKLNFPHGVAVDNDGNIYIADTGNHRIRKVDTNGIITTIAGNGQSGSSGDDGPATSAELNNPFAVSLDAAGDVYIADGGPDPKARIRRIDTNGAIKTIAGPGTGAVGYAGDGLPATLVSFSARDIKLDAAGNLYIADLANSSIRKADVSQSAALFATHAVGTTSHHRVVLTNTGNQHLNLGTLNITGAFNFLSDDDPSYCSSPPDIGPGFSCALPITFTPTDAGPFTGTATVTGNSLNQPGTTQTISLTGAGVNP